MKITDALLRQHAAEARDLWLGTLPQDETHVFSHRFRRKMKRLLAEQRRTPAMNRALCLMRRTAAALLIAASLTAASLLSVEAYREKFIEIVTEIFEDLTEFRYSGVAPADTPMPEVTLTYVPEGLVEVEREEDEFSRTIIFSDSDGARLYFMQLHVTEAIASTQIVDTEDAIVENRRVRDNDVTVVTKNDWHELLWTHEQMSYLLSGNIPLEEFIRMVEGVQQELAKK